MLVVIRVLVEPRVGFDSPDRVLIPDDVGEFIRPSIRIVVFTDRCFGVAALAAARDVCGAWSSSDPRLLGCIAWLVGSILAVDLPCAPFASSIPPFLATAQLAPGAGS